MQRFVTPLPEILRVVRAFSLGGVLRTRWVTALCLASHGWLKMRRTRSAVHFIDEDVWLGALHVCCVTCFSS